MSERQRTAQQATHSPHLRTPYELFGVECGEGWYPLLERFQAQIAKDREAGLEPIVLQIKEKYGLLRIYVAGCSDATFDLVDQLEDESGHVCEDCGEPGHLTNKGWYRTLCEACATREGRA